MIEYENTDAFGNVIYRDEETKQLYSFEPDEIEGKLLEDYPWSDHLVDEYIMTSYGVPVHVK